MGEDNRDTKLKSFLLEVESNVRDSGFRVVGENQYEELFNKFGRYEIFRSFCIIRRDTNVATEYVKKLLQNNNYSTAWIRIRKGNNLIRRRIIIEQMARENFVSVPKTYELDVIIFP